MYTAHTVRENAHIGNLKAHITGYVGKRRTEPPKEKTGAEIRYGTIQRNPRKNKDRKQEEKKEKDKKENGKETERRKMGRGRKKGKRGRGKQRKKEKKG